MENNEFLVSIHNEVLPMANEVGSVVCGLVAVGALLYAGSKVWPALAKGEPIDFYPLLRPFLIGFVCLYFGTLVVTPIQYLLSPIKNYASNLTVRVEKKGESAKDVGSMLEKVKESRSKQVAEYRQAQNTVLVLTVVESTKPQNVKNIEVSNKNQKAIEQAQKVLEDKVADSPNIQQLVSTSVEDEASGVVGRIKTALSEFFAEIFRKILDFIFSIMIYVFKMLRIIFLCLLNILGPLALGLSIFPSFQNNFVNWLTKYISIYLWAPLVDLVKALVDRCAYLLCTSPGVGGSLTISQLDWISVLVQLVGILILFAVPTVSSWLVQGGEDGRAMRGFSMVGGAAGGYAGGKAASVLKNVPFVNRFIK